MRRTVVIIVLAAAVAGALAGGGIGLVLDNGEAASTTTVELPAATPTSSTSRLSPEEIYQADAPGVVVITDTQTRTVPGTPFAPSSKQSVGALGSGFVIDKQGDIVTISVRVLLVSVCGYPDPSLLQSSLFLTWSSLSCGHAPAPQQLLQETLGRMASSDQ